MRKARVFKMIGGPLDGEEVTDHEGYFVDGDFEEVGFRDRSVTSEWSSGVVYKCVGNTLVYDVEQTRLLRSSSSPEGGSGDGDASRN